MRKLILIVTLTGLIGNIPFNSYSQSSPTTISGDENDGRALSGLMGMNMYELALLRMASEKAQSQELREMANKMLPEHQRIDAQLTAISNRLNFAVDPGKKEKYITKIEKWDADPVGEGWDKDMIEELVDLHKDGTDMLGAARKGLKDGELASLITTTLPLMQSHLDMLLPLKGKIKGGDVTAAGTPAVDVTGVASTIPQGNEKDAKFVSDLRVANLYELRLMELTFKKSSNRNLKDAAQHMIEDHQKLDRQVREYSKRHGYGIDPDEGSKVNEKLAKWNQKKGGMEWDADIIEEMRDVHKDGIDMLEDSQTDAKDDELSSLIKSTLPTMKMHLEMIDSLKGKIKKPWKEKK